MLPIIHQNINNQEINTVNARDLHKFLEIGKDLSTWIKHHIEQYGFIENQDFVKLPQKGEANNATVRFKIAPLKNLIDTFLTIYQYSHVETIRCEKQIRSSNESRVCPYGFMLVGFFYVYR